MSAPECRSCGRKLVRKSKLIFVPGERGKPALGERVSGAELYGGGRIFEGVAISVEADRVRSTCPGFRVAVWDGKSYGGRHNGSTHFCTDRCAIVFAEAVARDMPEVRLTRPAKGGAA